MRQLRYIFSLVIALAAVSGVAQAASAQTAAPHTLAAHTQTAVPNALTGRITLRDFATRLCLDSDGYGDAYMNDCNSGNYQKWIVVYTGGLVTFRNDATGL